MLDSFPGCVGAVGGDWRPQPQPSPSRSRGAAGVLRRWLSSPSLLLRTPRIRREAGGRRQAASDWATLDDGGCRASGNDDSHCLYKGAAEEGWGCVHPRRNTADDGRGAVQVQQGLIRGVQEWFDQNIEVAQEQRHACQRAAVACAERRQLLSDLNGMNSAREIHAWQSCNNEKLALPGQFRAHTLENTRRMLQLPAPPSNSFGVCTSPSRGASLQVKLPAPPGDSSGISGHLSRDTPFHSTTACNMNSSMHDCFEEIDQVCCGIQRTCMQMGVERRNGLQHYTEFKKCARQCKKKHVDQRATRHYSNDSTINVSKIVESIGRRNNPFSPQKLGRDWVGDPQLENAFEPERGPGASQKSTLSKKKASPSASKTSNGRTTCPSTLPRSASNKDTLTNPSPPMPLAQVLLKIAKHLDPRHDERPAENEVLAKAADVCILEAKKDETQLQNECKHVQAFENHRDEKEMIARSVQEVRKRERESAILIQSTYRGSIARRSRKHPHEMSVEADPAGTSFHIGNEPACILQPSDNDSKSELTGRVLQDMLSAAQVQALPLKPHRSERASIEGIGTGDIVRGVAGKSKQSALLVPKTPAKSGKRRRASDSCARYDGQHGEALLSDNSLPSMPLEDFQEQVSSRSELSRASSQSRRASAISSAEDHGAKIPAKPRPIGTSESAPNGSPSPAMRPARSRSASRSMDIEQRFSERRSSSPSPKRDMRVPAKPRPAKEISQMTLPIAEQKREGIAAKQVSADTANAPAYARDSHESIIKIQSWYRGLQGHRAARRQYAETISIDAQMTGKRWLSTDRASRKNTSTSASSASSEAQRLPRGGEGSVCAEPDATRRYLAKLARREARAQNSIERHRTASMCDARPRIRTSPVLAAESERGDGVSSDEASLAARLGLATTPPGARASRNSGGRLGGGSAAAKEEGWTRNQRRPSRTPSQSSCTRRGEANGKEITDRRRSSTRSNAADAHRRISSFTKEATQRGRRGECDDLRHCDDDILQRERMAKCIQSAYRGYQRKKRHSRRAAGGEIVPIVSITPPSAPPRWTLASDGDSDFAFGADVPPVLGLTGTE